MPDQSHSLLFLAATGAMCAVVFYGSEAGTFMSEADGVRQENTPLRDNAGASLLPDRAGESLLPDKTGASVLPNSASCPVADALVSPPRVNGAIGNDPPGPAPSTSLQAGRNANLGTGTACPSLKADAAKPGTVPGLAASGLEQGRGEPAVPHL